MTTIVYRQEYGDPDLCVRRTQRFLEAVAVEDQAVPRFQYPGGQE